jgi:hypothetical protein
LNCCVLMDPRYFRLAPGLAGLHLAPSATHDTVVDNISNGKTVFISEKCQN